MGGATMAIDPLLTLAYSVYTNKGVYAVLLGSGVSRDAGIPTGWEITLDLVEKVATLEEASTGGNPEGWYAQRYEKDPDYAELLGAVTKTSAERRELLHSYFVPNEEEREQGLKQPTAAHRAIALLVAKGYIKVILTTNFDRLMEMALRDAGVEPTVISSPDGVAGATPLPHIDCVVVKLHGDYLDQRLKNTEQELSHYDESVDAYLDRILDEFGLIVCGWSAEWDAALRSAIKRCPSRRYSTYWADKDSPTEKAAELMTLRRAELVAITDADSFFEDLAGKIESLEETERLHPLSSKLAVATLKRLMSDPRHRIRLHDFIMDETRRTADVLSGEGFGIQGGFSDQEFARRLRAYESATEILRSLAVYGAYWAEPENFNVWSECLQRTAGTARDGSGLVPWINMQMYLVPFQEKSYRF